MTRRQILAGLCALILLSGAVITRRVLNPPVPRSTPTPLVQSPRASTH